MPLFEYYCEACKAQSEILIRGAEKPACPKCGSKRLTKFASAFAPNTPSSKRTQVPPSCGSCSAAAGGGCPYK